MNFLRNLYSRADKVKATIVLPEANLDERVYKACKKIIKNNICNIIVLGKREQFDKTFLKDSVKIIDMDCFSNLETMVNCLYKLRKEKGVTKDMAREMLKSANYFAVMLVVCGYADGVVAGAKWTTADTLRPALQLLRRRGKNSLVSGSVLLVKNNDVKLFADVSLKENPDASELSQIAIAGAKFTDKILHIEPRVAMLSYSTKGSAKGELVDKVREAYKFASKSKYAIDGEMQVDSALDRKVAIQKHVTSEVGGNANVFIFPDINAGNIGYKIAARMGGYKAIGPITMNLKRPVNDLSRGCIVSEIIDTVRITKLMTIDTNS